MVLIRASLLIAVACRPAVSDRMWLLEECSCPCTEPEDAAIDVPVDASEIDLAAAWTRTVVTAGQPSGPLRGADGVSLDVEGCWTTAWEEGAAVSRACLVDGAWQTELVATGLSGAEDAEAADLDADGAIDVVTAAGTKVWFTFRGSVNHTISPLASQGHGGPMQVEIVDVNADGRLDVVFGTRIGSPAVVAWLENPGSTDARIGLAWTYHEISQAGWVMSLEAMDVNSDGRMDVVVSDRAKIGTADWSLYGARWSEQMSDGTWQSRAISLPAGSCSPYTSPSCTKTPGDAMMLDVADIDGDTVLDVVLGSSAGSQVDSRIVTYRNVNAWLGWVATALSPVAAVGHYQDSLVMDVDLDGDSDLVVSTWKGNAMPLALADVGKSGLYWLRNDGGTWSRGEVSGAWGAKFDNLERYGPRCVITSDQLANEGVVILCPPGVP